MDEDENDEIIREIEAEEENPDLSDDLDEELLEGYLNAMLKDD